MERKFITVTKTVTEQVAANRVRITLTAYGEAKKYAAAVESASEAASAATEGARPMMLRAAAYSDNAVEPEEITLSETVVCSWEIA